MATIVLSAAGQVIGGPIGSAVGALIGSQIDLALFAPKGREGARLQELKVTTSSYGTAIARHYGRVRTGGSIIWATDLVESSEKSGGKGKPSVTSFSYSASFAVAVSSRPIRSVGRIWADGNLLRGAAGDLKVAGELRIHLGYGDQLPDQLLVSDKGAQCPAFRGLAYCVFEGLQLSDFGNRIPTLTFEVVADDGDVALTGMIPSLTSALEIDRPLPALAGFSEEGGSLASTLQAIDEVYPFSCDASASALAIRSIEQLPTDPVLLPPAAVDPSGDSFGGTSGSSARRQADLREVPEGLRYYDLTRDFQAGLQRADGRARPGRSRIIEFPGALEAEAARTLANKAAERATWGHERTSWRLPELDPSLSPGQVVRVPGKKGLWRIDSWEWRETGVELELLRVPHGPARSQSADAGSSLPKPDLAVSPTLLDAFELPWDGQGSSAQRQAFAAASSVSAGWTGAALFAEQAGALEPIGATGRQRSMIGQLATALAPSQSALIDRFASFELELAAADFVLAGSDAAGLATGANRALVGEEMIQFANAVRIGASRWRVSALLRGRGGTEGMAAQGHAAGVRFVLLNSAPLALDPTLIGHAGTIAANGLADLAPVLAPITMAGATLRPLTPVHASHRQLPDGSLALSWTRRARGAWEWRDLVDTPLVEEAERYLVGLGDPQAPALQWEVVEPSLELAPALLATITADHAGKPFWVRQIGSFSASDPLLLHTVP